MYRIYKIITVINRLRRIRVLHRCENFVQHHDRWWLEYGQASRDPTLTQGGIFILYNERVARVAGALVLDAIDAPVRTSTVVDVTVHAPWKQESTKRYHVHDKTRNLPLPSLHLALSTMRFDKSKQTNAFKWETTRTKRGTTRLRGGLN